MNILLTKLEILFTQLKGGGGGFGPGDHHRGDHPLVAPLYGSTPVNLYENDGIVFRALHTGETPLRRTNYPYVARFRLGKYIWFIFTTNYRRVDFHRRQP